MRRKSALQLACALASCGVGLPDSLAQTTATPPANRASYTDRLIDGGTLAPDVTQDEATNEQRTGLPLRLSVSLRAVSQHIDERPRTTSFDTVVQAQIDTHHYGAWSIALTQRTDPRSLFGRIDQRGMPFDGGWYLDNALGMVTTAAPQAGTSSALSRFTVPVQSVFGVSTQISNPTRDQSLSVSVGERYQSGNDVGIGFQRLGGHFVNANAQAAITPTLRMTAALLSAREDSASEMTVKSGDSAYVGASWTLGSARVEANAIASRTAEKSRSGLRVESQWNDGPLAHYATVFRFDPGLTWGTTSSVSDLEGASYRASYRSRQWLGEATAELFRPLSIPNKTGVYLNANGRVQLARDWAVGGNASIRYQDGTAFLLRGFVDATNWLGQSHVQLSRERTENGKTRSGANLDHTFSIASLARASASISVDDERATTTGNRTDLSAGLSIGYNVASSLGLDVNVRARHALKMNAASSISGGAPRTSVDAYAGVSWAVSPGWMLALTYGDSQGRFDLPVSLDPLQPVVTPITRTSSRYLFASINYQYSSGRAEMPIGGRVGSPAGSIAGVVFLDDNENGRRDANESGAANVQVLLDGRFSVRTDSQGRFEFPFVASGEHYITVPSENLPLPWSIALERRSVQIRARDTTLVEVPATRLR